MTISNENPETLDKPEPTLDDKLVMSQVMVGHSVDKVSKQIDNLSSSGLKRVLKIISHVHFGEAVLGLTPIQLKEDEQVLVDSIFELQETVFGYTALKQEADQKSNNDSGLGEDISFSNVKGDSNE